jgi:hypothetical protein
MKAAELKSFRKPDEIRQFPNGRLEIINIGGATVGRPFWSRVEMVDLCPADRKTRSCEASHFQYHVSGSSAHPHG